MNLILYMFTISLAVGLPHQQNQVQVVDFRQFDFLKFRFHLAVSLALNSHQDFLTYFQMTFLRLSNGQLLFAISSTQLFRLHLKARRTLDINILQVRC